MIWVLIAAAVLLLFLVPRIWRNPGFWKLAQRYPELALDWFESEDCWIVQRKSGPEPSAPGFPEDYSGPFRLHVPSLPDPWIKVYAHHDRIVDSQTRFLEAIDRFRKSSAEDSSGTRSGSSGDALGYRLAFDTHIGAIFKASGLFPSVEAQIRWWPPGATPEWVTAERALGTPPTEAATLAMATEVMKTFRSGATSADDAAVLLRATRGVLPGRGSVRITRLLDDAEEEVRKADTP